MIVTMTAHVQGESSRELAEELVNVTAEQASATDIVTVEVALVSSLVEDLVLLAVEDEVVRLMHVSLAGQDWSSIGGPIGSDGGGSTGDSLHTQA